MSEKQSNRAGLAFIAMAFLALGLGACAAVDKVTGTTIEERCFYRAQVVAQLEAREAELNQLETNILDGYRAYVATVCAGV